MPGKGFITVLCVLIMWCHQPLRCEQRFEYLIKEVVADGIKDRQCNCFFQDDKGYMWIGTFTGLNCYDGYQNIVYKDPYSNNNLFNRVLCLEKDHLGNLWIGKEYDRLSLLNVFTRRFFRIYFRSEDKKYIPFSVSSIKAVNKNEVWVGTQGGKIYRIRYSIAENNTSDSVLFSPEEMVITAEMLRNPGCVFFLKDFAAGLLIGYNGGGLVQVDYPVTGRRIKGKIIVDAPVNAIFEDVSGTYWVGTTRGVRCLKYDLKGKKFVEVSTGLSSLSGCNVLSITGDKKQNLYIGTEKNGLFFVHPEKQSLERLENYRKENSTLLSDWVNIVYMDRLEKLWIGTQDEGVNVLDLNQKRFHALKYYDYSTPQNEMFISSVLQDSRKRVWVGSRQDGLYCFDRLSGKRFHKGPHSFKNNSSIVDIYEDRRGNVWFCSRAGLMYLPHNRPFSGETELEEVTGPEGLIVTDHLVEDEYGRYWINSDKELMRFTLDASGKAVSKVSYWVCSPEVHITNLKHTENNTLWVCTMGDGLLKVVYNGRNDRIHMERYNPENRNERYISDRNVWSVLSYRDSLWVGTNNGLNLYTRNPQHQYEYRKTWYSGDGGLLAKEIGYILNDKEGNLWMKTSEDLTKFLADRRSFVHFKDGLQSNILTNGSCQPPFETMYIGTIKGLTYFNPAEIHINCVFPSTVLTHLLVNNEEVHAGYRINGQVILKKALPYTSEIFLSYKNNHFTLHFSAFNFDLPQSNSFSYKLVGYDDKWIQTFNHENVVSYSNLPAGKYVFMVTATNSDGVSDLFPATLKIVVGNPPWKSWWAYVLYALTIVGMVLMAIRYYRNKIRLQHEVLLEKRKRQQEHELADMKIHFFTNISHELRTPLTLISAPLSEINAEGGVSQARLKELLNLIAVNTGKLLRLVNQLLDFSKFGHEMVALRASQNDVVRFVRNLVDTFRPLARQKSINLLFSSAYMSYEGYMDADVMDQILSNLIFNAIKYTPEHRSVEVGFDLVQREQGPFFQIQVSDTGAGIESDKLDRVFDRYYQEKHGQGYGIGLSVVKNLLQLHYGTIEIKSEPGKGTLVTVEIPAYPSAYDCQENAEALNITQTDSVIPETSLPFPDSGRKKAILLIVEDNRDLREYLCSNLSKYYKVLAAENGKTALRLAFDQMPDLIVSDIMMPEMDGMALASALQSDMRTNHIPFIFLTAVGNLERQQQGLTIGAVDYIVKPFDTIVLLKKIENQLRIIDSNRERQKKKLFFEPSDNMENGDDEGFVEKVSRIIEENLSDPFFNVDKLSEIMAMSRRHLYRKLAQSKTSFSMLHQAIKSAQGHGMNGSSYSVFVRKAIHVIQENMADPTFDVMRFSSEMAVSYRQLHRKLKAELNLSVTEFIRTIQMKHAAEWLKSGERRVSEVMFKVGYDDPSHFAKVFRQQYGMSPTEYQEKNKQREK